MKFMLQLVPTVPASPVERERLRPIAHRTEKIQQMLDEMVDLAQLVEELGFAAVTYSEHHFYTDEAAKAGRSFPIGQNIGLARLLYLGDTREEALERARKGSIFLFRQFHAKFYPQIPTTIEPLIEAGIAFVGTVDDVRRQMAAVQEQLNPEWFMIISDQGFMPLYEVKKQMELFGTKVMPEFMG